MRRNCGAATGHGGASIGEKFGSFDSVKELLTVLKANGVTEIDSAALYPPLDIGASERLLGAAGAIDQGFKVNTKILVHSVQASGTLTPAKIEASVDTSVDQLRLHDGQRLHVLHAHTRDDTTPLKDQLAGFEEQYRKGRFEQLGVCNFPIETVEEIIQICEEEGYVKPTVYEGRYNLIARQREELIPVLREYGISFTAHSTLASAFLTGSLTSGKIENTRFIEGHYGGEYAREKYDKPAFHDAIRTLDKVLEPHGISKIKVSLRWICYHSVLTSEDAIILGATRTEQIVQNVESIKRGPLPDAVVAAIDGIWESVANEEIPQTAQNFDPSKK